MNSTKNKTGFLSIYGEGTNRIGKAMVERDQTASLYTDSNISGFVEMGIKKGKSDAISELGVIIDELKFNVDGYISNAMESMLDEIVTELAERLF